MAMNITSSTGSAKLQQAPQQNQAQQAAKPKAPAASQQQPKPAQQTQAPQPEQQPKPVVNALGQTTGRMVNVKA
ncbi:MAG TPA: hypothetical protein VF801_08900 [Rhodocyclaceae bacterium]